MVVSPCPYMQVYTEQHQNPPLGNNMPPISGKICWARQLLHHLEKSMAVLKHYKQVILSFHNGRTLFRKYNKTALILTEYELTHYKAWTRIVELSSKSLQVP